MIPPPAPVCLRQAAKPTSASKTDEMPTRGFATAVRRDLSSTRREAQVVG